MKLPILPPWASTVLRFAPYIAIAVLAGLLYLSNGRADGLKAKLEAKSMMFDEAIKSRDSYYYAVQQRDALIGKQNASIQSLADAAKVNRDAYVAGIQVARTVSADHLKVSSELLALTAPDGEIEQCRAARDLLESELVGTTYWNPLVPK